MPSLGFGTTLVLVPFSFVYVPELLLQGTAAEIAFATVSYLLGYTALAVAIQGIEFFVGPVALWRRALFLGAAVCFLLPMILWLKLIGQLCCADQSVNRAPSLAILSMFGVS